MPKGRKTTTKEGRLSGAFKKEITDLVIRFLVEEYGLSKVQARRTLSYAYQSLRERKGK